MKILHIADIHARDADIEEVERCLHHIVAIAHQYEPHLIINAGDTFDSRSVRLDSQAAKLVFRIFSELADIAPVAVITGTPSHDGEAVDVLKHINANHQMWVSKRPEQVYLLDGCFSRIPWPEPCEVVISCIPQPTKQFFSTDLDIKGSDAEIASAMGGIFAGFGAKAAEHNAPHVLIGHFQVGGAMISETQILTGVDVEISKDQIALANADLVCLGHIHKSQKLGDNIFYSGSICRLNYGELDEKGVYIHTVNSDSIDSVFELTPTRKLVKLAHDLTVEGAIDELDMVLYSFEPDEIKDGIVKCEFKVYTDQSEKLDKKTIEKFYLSAGAKEVDVSIIRVPRENVRSERILKLTTLREKLIEMAGLKEEIVPESILAKADILESETGDQIVARIASL